MKNWDDEIGRVARAMSEGEPDGSLKARVLARIDGPPRWGWGSPWILAPIATVAIAVVAVFVMRGPTEVRLKPDTTPEVRLKPDTTADTVRLKPDTTANTIQLRPDTTTVAPKPDAPAVVTSASRRPSVVASAFRRTDEDLDSLAPPPLEIDPIGVDGVENMESLQVPALSVALLDVPAIGEQ